MKAARAVAVLLALALGALVLWLAGVTEWVDEEVDVPLSDEAARNPFLAAQQLVGKLGAAAVVQPNLDQLPPPGATLWLMSPHWMLFPERKERLRRWVMEQGGHLVIPASDLGWPHRPLLSWVPMSQEAAAHPDAPKVGPSRPGAHVATPCRSLQEAPAEHALYPGLEELTVCSEEPFSQRIRSTAPAAWNLVDPDGACLMRLPLGRGSVTATVWTAAFQNRDLLRGDNGLVLAAALGLQRGRVVWFVTDEARDPLLQVLWRWAAPAWVAAAAAVALALWRAAARFGPPQPDTPAGRRSVAEQVRGTAAFVWRYQPGALLAAQQRALAAAARGRIAHYDPSDPHACAAALERFTGLPRDALAAALAPAAAPRSTARVAALLLLERARRRLLRAAVPDLPSHAAGTGTPVQAAASPSSSTAEPPWPSPPPT